MTKERSITTKKGNAAILSQEEQEFSQKIKQARSSNLLWHLLTMGQMAATFVLLLFVIYHEGIIFFHNGTQKISIDVPQKPLPGFYDINELPDDDLLSFGEEFINLVATYQRHNAEKQFIYAFDMTSGDFKKDFKNQYIAKNIKEIKKSKRAQIFYPDSEPVLTRASDYAIVSLDGEIEKYADGRPFNTFANYQVKLEIVPHSTMNDYGISVVDLKINTDSGY